MSAVEPIPSSLRSKTILPVLRGLPSIVTIPLTEWRGVAARFEAPQPKQSANVNENVTTERTGCDVRRASFVTAEEIFQEIIQNPIEWVLRKLVSEQIMVTVHGAMQRDRHIFLDQEAFGKLLNIVNPLLLAKKMSQSRPVNGYQIMRGNVPDVVRALKLAEHFSVVAIREVEQRPDVH